MKKTTEEKKIKEKRESYMLFKIGLWLSKFMNDYNTDSFVYKIENVTDDKGKNIGSYELTVKKLDSPKGLKKEDL